MNDNVPAFRPPSSLERVFNRIWGFLVGLGLGFSYNYLLQVRGRKSGKVHSTPIDLLEVEGKRFLVAPRGRTQWVRNAEASGEVVLKKGSSRQMFGHRPLPEEEKLCILKAYLETFKAAVQRYFPIQAGSPPEAFRAVAENYPAFELLPKNTQLRWYFIAASLLAIRRVSCWFLGQMGFLVVPRHEKGRQVSG